MSGTKLVSIVLEYLQSLITEYDWLGKVIIKVILGFDGMGPSVTISILDAQHKPAPPNAEIQFWAHPTDGTKAVLIFTAFTAAGEDIDNQSLDISNMDDARPYFEQAMQLFAVEESS